MSKKEKVELFCTGTHFGNGNVRLIGFIVLEKGKTTDETLYYSLSKIRAGVGHVYTVDMSKDDGHQTMYGKPRWVREFEDEEFVLKHRLESEKNETLFLAMNQAKKALKEKKDILNCLKPIREKWRNTNTQGQVALEARVLYYLRAGGDL